MTDLELLQKIYVITEQHDRPPYVKGDPEFRRYPWPLFGCRSSGGWHWFSNDIIFLNVSAHDVRAALEELGE